MTATPHRCTLRSVTRLQLIVTSALSVAGVRFPCIGAKVARFNRGGYGVTNVRYQATGVLPDGVPAAVVARHGEVCILIAEHLTVAEVCAALTPLITEHVQQCWRPLPMIA